MDLHSVEELLKSTVEKAVALARSRGADQAAATASSDEGISVTVRMGELESVERQRDRGLSLTVYKNQCTGSASTSVFSDQGIKAAVEKALSIASFTAPDPCAGLADEALMATAPPDLDLCHPWPVDVEAATEIALQAETAARDLDSRIENSEGATLVSGTGIRAYANSHGFLGAYPSSSHSLSCSVVASGDDSSERDYWYSAARDPSELESATAVGQRAAERALRRLGARPLTTRVAPVLYPPELARGLFGHMVAAIRGTSQYRKASFLLDGAGKQIFPSLVNIDEDPHIAKGMASAPFDAEGVATQRRRLVADGVLESYVLSSYSARRLGLQTTGNAGGIHNLIVEPTAGPLQSLIEDCKQGLLLTELLGHGANTVTGDYSRGAAGYWIENGELAYPVNEVTVAGNLAEIFQRILAIGTDIDLRGAIRCGSVLIAEMTVAGR